MPDLMKWTLSYILLCFIMQYIDLLELYITRCYIMFSYRLTSRAKQYIYSRGGTFSSSTFGKAALLIKLNWSAHEGSSLYTSALNSEVSKSVLEAITICDYVVLFDTGETWCQRYEYRDFKFSVVPQPCAKIRRPSEWLRSKLSCVSRIRRKVAKSIAAKHIWANLYTASYIGIQVRLTWAKAMRLRPGKSVIYALFTLPQGRLGGYVI
jgi:hypothetical protein